MFGENNGHLQGSLIESTNWMGGYYSEEVLELGGGRESGTALHWSDRKKAPQKGVRRPTRDKAGDVHNYEMSHSHAPTHAVVIERQTVAHFPLTICRGCEL